MIATPPRNAGSWQAKLSIEHTGAFRKLLGQATTFTMGLYGLRASLALGKGKLPQVKEALELLPVVPTALFVANRWMGSATPQTLVVWAKISKDFRNCLVSWRTPWETIGKWEDLALFTEERAIFWSTSHESEGFALGDASVLNELGLPGTPREDRPADLTPIDPEALASLGVGR